MRAWLAATGLLLLLAVTPTAATAAVDGTGAAKKRKAAAKTCKAGTTPIVVKRGRKAVIRRDRRGRPRCRRIKRSAVRAPARTPSLQVGQVADVLRSAANINPKAFKRLERVLGRRRADRLMKVSLNAWRDTAGAAARASASETKTFSEGPVDGKATFGVEEVKGAQSGFKATASAEMKISRADLEKFSSALKDKLPSDVTGATAKVDVSFEDVAATCPNAKGEVPGKLRGKGSLAVTIERSDGPPIKLTLGADVDTTYTADVGADGTVSKINDVEVQTRFQTGGTGNSTETYRGRRLGTGFGTKGILDAPPGGADAAIQRDLSHIDQNRGGVFGPHGSWRYDRPFPISDLRTIDNVKAMVATAVATNVLTFASLEYLRKITRDRIEKSPCGYFVLVVMTSRTETAQYRGIGNLRFPVEARAVPGSANRWRGQAQALFTNLTFTPKTECAMHTPVNTPGTFTVDIEQVPSGNIRVTWSANPQTSASIDCPPDDSEPPHDPPPVAGMPGPSLLGATPGSFELPANGGVQAIAGGVDGGGGDGFFPTGSIQVSRNR